MNEFILRCRIEKFEVELIKSSIKVRLLVELILLDEKYKSELSQSDGAEVDSLSRFKSTISTFLISLNI